MLIQMLSLQLANQIIAGEVAERPASVVKELLKNSLDAGATRIEIDIHHGDTKGIRIRDNDNGIAKEELVLALARFDVIFISQQNDKTVRQYRAVSRCTMKKSRCLNTINH